MLPETANLKHALQLEPFTLIYWVIFERVFIEPMQGFFCLFFSKTYDAFRDL